MGAEPSGELRYTSTSYFSLATQGLLAADDRVELLDGIIVAMPPRAPFHATGIRRVERGVYRGSFGGQGFVAEGRSGFCVTRKTREEFPSLCACRWRSPPPEDRRLTEG